MDFLLSNSGDLVVEEHAHNRQFKLSYRVSEQSGFTLRFHVLNEKDDVENKGLRLSFNVNNNSDLRHHAKVINDIDEKIQMIRVGLRTELSQLPRRAYFGSELVKYRHEDIHSEQILDLIQATALNAVSRILSNPSVKAAPKKGTGNLYFHNVSLSIYEDNVKIFEFTI